MDDSTVLQMTREQFVQAFVTRFQELETLFAFVEDGAYSRQLRTEVTDRLPSHLKKPVKDWWAQMHKAMPEEK